MRTWEALALAPLVLAPASALWVLRFRVYEPWLRTAAPWRSAGKPMAFVRVLFRNGPKPVDAAEAASTIEASGGLVPFARPEWERRLLEAEPADAGRMAWSDVAVMLASPDLSLWVSSPLVLLWLLWILRDMWFQNHLEAYDCPTAIHGNCARAIIACGKVRDREDDTLTLDARVETVIRALGLFAKYGHWRGGPTRCVELIEHATQVQGSLRDAVGAVFRDGDDALPTLVEHLVTIMERAAAGRWMGLLDPAALPAEPLPVPTMSRTHRLAEAAGVLALTMGAAGLIVGALALNLPTQFAAVFGLAGFLGGGLAWRGKRFGLTTRGIFGAVSAGFSGSSTSPPPAPPANGDRTASP